MDPIEILKSLEPTFMEAGQLAYKMQKGVSFYNKHNTDNHLADIVTEADLKVQEFLLQELSKTELVNCHLLAEENTPSTTKFNSSNEYYLSIDPIDGTLIYSRGDKLFSTIISLHDGNSQLYTYNYFPAYDFTMRIAESVEIIGQTPIFDLPSGYENMILHYRNPQQTIPDIYKDLESRGLKFISIKTLPKMTNPQAAYLCGKTSGFFVESPNVYDGLTSLHFGLAKGKKVYSEGPNGKFDLLNIKKRETGLYYEGYYLVLNS